MSKKISDNELDDFYDTIDLLMRNDKWNILNELFQMWGERVWRTDIDRLLCCATASFAGKSKIPMRSLFMEKCKLMHPNKKLWVGLE